MKTTTVTTVDKIDSIRSTTDEIKDEIKDMSNTINDKINVLDKHDKIQDKCIMKLTENNTKIIESINAYADSHLRTLDLIKNIVERYNKDNTYIRILLSLLITATILNTILLIVLFTK